MARSAVVGDSTGIGLVTATRVAARGAQVVIASRSPATAEAVARDIGAGATPIGLDFAAAALIADAVPRIDVVDNLVITAIEQAVNTVAEFDIDQAVRSVTVTLVGYVEVVRAQRPHVSPTVSVVLYGGRANDLAIGGGVVPT